MRNVAQSIVLAVSLGLRLLGASEVKAEPKAQWTAAVKAAVACSKKVLSTSDTRTCWITQIDKARRQLDKEYAGFLNAIPLEKREDFVSAHKAWEKYHSAHCRLYMNVFEGTMWHPVSDQCVLEQVEHRTRELSEMRRAYTLP